MSTMPTIEELAQRGAVLEAVTAFLELANTHPSTPEGHTFTAEASGSKYRIVQSYGGNDRSVHAFVDATTGDLLKAASWKVPAKGVRFNLLTQMDLIKERFYWSGRYLYLR